MKARNEEVEVKVGERKFSGGIVVEYFCIANAPSIEESMAQVTSIAADALMRSWADGRQFSSD